MTFPHQIAIVGIGLIGGSIAMGLKRKMEDKMSIMGLCSNSERTRQALSNNLIDHPVRELTELRNVELIILSTPISSLKITLAELGNILNEKSLVMDVSSVKKSLSDYIGKLNPRFRFIGTHPMAGSEKKGFENAQEDLFAGKPWVITEIGRNTRADLTTVTELIKILGAREVSMDADFHDRNAAWASHLSLILSSIIIKTVKSNSGWGNVTKLISSGFLDSTRLASHDPLFKTDLMMENKENILRALNRLQKEINSFCRYTAGADQKDLLNYFTQAKKIRDNI